MSRAQQKGKNPLEMSDEEFMNMNGPDSYIPADDPNEGNTADEEKEEEQQAEKPDDAAAAEEEDAEGADAPEAGSDDGGEAEEEGEGDDPKRQGEEDGGNEEDLDGAEDEGASDKPAAAADAKPDDTKDKDGEPDESKTTPGESQSKPDYEAFYSMIMGGFRANGKTIELKSPEEALQLMQMGANYTQKMQAIQPHRKVLLMLEKNEIDAGKLSFAIDLLKKDPEAIRKLVKDAGIDPMDIDTESEPEYRGGNHEVSDEEEAFRGAVEDLLSTETGKATLQSIQSTWDQTSKDMLWAQPDVLAIIHQQHENGVYAKITAEMDRQRTLGNLPVNTPFMQAYQAIGNQLQKAGAFGTSVEGDGPAVPLTPPVRKATERPARPKPQVTNGEQAKAAASSRRSSRQSKQFVNPLAMSDEEFMKLDALKNRV